MHIGWGWMESYLPQGISIAPLCNEIYVSKYSWQGKGCSWCLLHGSATWEACWGKPFRFSGTEWLCSFACLSSEENDASTQLPFKSQELRPRQSTLALNNPVLSLSLWHLLYAQLFNSVSAHPSVNWFHGILVWSTIPTSQITGTICLISLVVLCHLLLPESWYNTLVGNLSTGKEHT